MIRHGADLYILTGAPGSGKTAIIDRVASDIRCVREPAREILSEQRAVAGHGTPDTDPSLFVDLLLRRSIDNYEEVQAWKRPALFDRGVPDCIAYARLLGIDPAPSIRATETHRYHNEVLVLPPWKEIYVVDDERTMSFADTFAFHEILLDVYERAGYSMVELPRASVVDRVVLVREFVTPR